MAHGPGGIAARDGKRTGSLPPPRRGRTSHGVCGGNKRRLASAEAAPISKGEILQIDSPPPNHGHVKLVSFVGSEDELCSARGRADTVATSHVATAEVVPSADPFLQLLRALRMDDEEDVAVFRVAGVRNTRDLLELEEDDLKHDDLMLMPLMTRKKLQRFVSQPMQEKQKKTPRTLKMSPWGAQHRHQEVPREGKQ